MATNRINTNRKRKGPKQFKAATFSNNSVSGLFGTRNTVKSSGPWEAFYNNEWVYAAVKARSESFAGLVIKTVNSNGEVDLKNPAMALLLNPNDLQTRYELMESISISLSLFGVTYMWLEETAARIQIHILDPTEVVPMRPQANGMVSSYSYKGQAILPEDIVVFREPGKSPWDVISAVKASIGSFHMDQFAKQWNERFFVNGGAPATIIKLDPDKYTEEEFKIVLDKFQTHLTGMKNHGRTTVMAEDFDVVQVSESPKDIDFSSLTKAVMERILATLRVPKTLIGLTEDVNRASAQAAEYTFQKNVNKPSAQRFVEKLNQEYVPKLRIQLTGVASRQLNNVFFTFDDPVPQDQELELKQVDQMGKYGAITINEMRQTYGFEKLKEGDVLIQRNTSVAVPVEAESGQRSFEPHTKKKDGINLKSYSDKYKKAIPRIGAAFVKRFEQSEVIVQARMVTLFNTQEVQVLKNLRKEAKATKQLEEDDINDVLFDVDKEAERFWKKMGPVFLGIMAVEGEIATNEVVPGMGDTFDIRVPSTANALRKQEQRFAEPVNQTTWDRLRKTLAEGVEKGEGIQKLRKRVNDIYESARQFRSVSIARTEVLTAANSGRDIAFTELGVEEKIWVTANDFRVRETHVAADGQASKDGRFKVGGEGARYPGDTSLSGGESINCRCTVVAQI